jgi:hypothetical protein
MQYYDKSTFLSLQSIGKVRYESKISIKKTLKFTGEKMIKRIFTINNMNSVSGNYFMGALFLITLLVIYLPVINGYYLYSDDYLFLYPKSDFGLSQTGFWMNSVFKEHLSFSVSTGKPLYFLFLILANICIENIDSANLFRFGAIAVLALFCTLNWVWLVRHQVKAFDAFIVSVIIGSLPAMNLTVAWIVMSGVLPSLILSILASLLVFKSIHASTGTAKNGWRCGAIVAMVSAISTYQLSAMYYWVAVAVMLLSIELNNWKQSREMIAKYFLVGIFSMILYIFVGRIIPDILGVAVSGRGNLDVNVIDKLGWFISGPTFNAVNFINLFPSTITAALVVILIVAGIIIEGSADTLKITHVNNPRPQLPMEYAASGKIDTFDRWLMIGIAIGAFIAMQYLFLQVARSQPNQSLWVSYWIVAIEILVLAPLCIRYYSSLFRGFNFISRKIVSFLDENLFLIAQKWLVVIGLLLLCCSPFLLSSGGKINGQRVLIAYSPFVVILLFNGYKRIRALAAEPIKIALLATFLLFGIHCAWSARYVVGDLIVRPQTIEARYMLSELERNYSSQIREIHVFRPRWWTGMVPFTIPPGYEIGLYSSSVSSNTKNMVLCMLNEMGVAGPRNSSKSIGEESIKITSSIGRQMQSHNKDENDPVPEASPAVLFIDMLAIR